jgi:hypothetical protein
VRITSDINSAARTRMHGTLNPMARTANDAGSVPGKTVLHGISMIFSKSDVQKADLKALLKAQEDPASPLYHNWLTPEQFAARFGMAQADLDKASAWLEQQGFAIERISRGHDRIYFTGTVAQVNGSFATTLRYYNVDGKKHFAASTELSLPAALAGVVLNIGNLDDFKPQAMHHKVSPMKPDFTSGISGSHFVAPGDIATIYNIAPAYQAGWTGHGQSIAIVGQSDVDLTDIQRFQAAAGVTSPKDPVKVLVPTTGNAGDFYVGDMAESDLDLEWSGAIAPDATIYFVFTGDGGNAGVFDSLVYAIETRISPIISVSYGGCEIAIGSPANVQSLDDIFQQGTAQGQSLIAASGDDGASGCFRDTALSAADRTALSISFPADSAYFTGVGGTQFNEGSGTYWDSKPGTDIISSALSYIPEAVWNEDDPKYGLGSSGGGVSTLYAKPDWQAGVPGIPNDGMRDSPDIALDSAGGHDGLLFCTSDANFWQDGQQASCDAGFRDSATNDVTYGGGTSFAAPILAGMIALLNQQQNSTGLGLLNPKLYSLASDPTTYASAFHDVVAGSNRCTTGEAGFCPNGPTGYDATTGYDLTTGLGTINFDNLMKAWGAPSLSASTTTLKLLTETPTTSAPVQIGIAVAATSGSGVPTGNVTMTVDGETDSTPVTLDNGSANYNATIGGSGNHVIVATYSGDTTYAASTTSLVVNTQIETQIQLDMPSTVLTGSLSTILFRVEPTSGLDLPDGTVTVLLDGNAILYGAPLVNGVANYTGIIRTGGKHTLAAAYSGSTKYASSTHTVEFYAVTGTTMSVITSSGAPVVGGTDTVTVQIAPSSGSTVPAGALQVLVNGAMLTPAPELDATGSAAFPVTFLHAGVQSVSVTYPGNTVFAPARGAVTVGVQPAGTTTTIAASNQTPASGAADTFTITVGSSIAGLIPEGSVQLTVDGAAAEAPLVLTNGVATYSTSFTKVGDHTVSAVYTGSSDFAPSNGSDKVSVPAPAFTLTASNATMPHNGSGVATITVTPAAGYSGVIHFTVSTGELENTCYSLPDLEVDSNGPATASLKLSAASKSCSAMAASGLVPAPQAPRPGKNMPYGLAFAGTILLGIARTRRRLKHWLIVLLLVACTGIAVTGCGGSSSHTPQKGAYTVTVTGTDTKLSSIQSSVQVSVTVN